VGWVIRGKQNIEQPTKLAFPNEADVADFYG
jgi:hypothetical protein